MSKDKIIIVVDDRNISQNLETKLVDSNYSVIPITSNFDTALPSIIKNNPSLIVISVKLQGEFCGIELAKQITAEINVPIIFISLDDDDEAYLKAKTVNPIAFFTHPFGIHNLFSAIEIGLSNHQLQQDLIDTRNKYELVIKSARAGVYEIDPATFEIEIDETLTEIFGYTVQEVKENGWGALLPIQDFNKKKEIIANLLQGKISSYFVELRIIKKSGGFSWALSSGSLAKDKSGKVKIVGTLTDITERKKAEQQLKEYSEDLKSINSTKDKFFSMISHDLRNPFNSLLGFSELLANNIEELTKEEIKDSAKTLHKQANNLFNLLTNLLEWSQLQTGKFSNEKTEFSISSVVNYVLDLYQETISQKEIKIIKGEDCDIKVYADRKMIESATRNLVSNALKFTKRNGTVNVSCVINGNSAEICLQDSGVGMSQEDQERLFKVDKQFSTEGTDFEKGTGFGLLLTKEFVEKNGGTIKFKSEKNKGSTFIISLPYKV